jgi:hypothetical protein
MMEDEVPSDQSESGAQVEDEISKPEERGGPEAEASEEEGIPPEAPARLGEEPEEREPEGLPESVPEADEPEREAPKEPSRISRFLRKSLRWATAVILVFALGVLATWLTRVRPQAQALRELGVERDSILARAEEIDAELLEVQGDLRALEAERDALQAQLEQAEAERETAQNHLDLLKVLVDVSAAQLAVAQEEPLQARAALEPTDERLASLQRELTGEPGERVGDLRDRLALALESIGEDDFAAQRDLEVLANTLLAIERLAFEE